MEKSCYSKVHTKEEWVVEPEAVRNSCSSSVNHRNLYPGMRRNPIQAAAVLNNPDIVLVKTGGNALKAVSRQDLVQNNNNNNNPNNNNNAEESVLSVVVPTNMKSGDALHVQAPDGRIIAVTIPPGIYPGQSFMVKVPPVESQHCHHQQHQQQHQQQQPFVSHPPDTTDSIPFSQALDSNYATSTTTTTSNTATSSTAGWSQTMFSNMFSPSSQQTTSNHNTTTNITDSSNDTGDLILVQVPTGYGPGSKLHVQVPPDGRLVEATVPPGNVTQFYMRLPATTPANIPVARAIFP